MSMSDCGGGGNDDVAAKYNDGGHYNNCCGWGLVSRMYEYVKKDIPFNDLASHDDMLTVACKVQCTKTK